MSPLRSAAGAIAVSLSPTAVFEELFEDSSFFAFCRLSNVVEATAFP